MYYKSVATRDYIQSKQALLVRKFQRLSSSLEKTNDHLHLYLKDPQELTFLWVNDYCAALYGRTPEQMVGLSDKKLYPARFARKFMQQDQKVLRAGTPLQVTNPVCHVNEEERWSMELKWPIYDKKTGVLIALGGISVRVANNDPETKVFKNQTFLKIDLLNAIQNHEFIPFFQPQVDRDGVIRRVEILIRWQKPDGIIVPPDDFIPFAEDKGLIQKIGSVFLSDVARTLAAWKKNALLAPLQASINISPKQLDLGLYTTLSNYIQRKLIDPQKLRIEITEKTFNYVQQHEEIMSIIMDMQKKLGLTLAIDDFGKDYSALDRLKHVSFAELKLDKMWVDDLINPNPEIQSRNSSIITGIIAMAHSLGCEIVAEGVESKEQFEMLKELGVDYCQGYYFGKPMREHDLLHNLKPQ
jgi:EAL domain-containing protein (putative c-di-GMP-specific phosphodiesterase class I)